LEAVEPLSKDWNQFYVKGPCYNEEIIIVNSYKNSNK